ncbi:glycosyltransferase family 2 protein [Bacteroides clarus]|uniref:glycosyltransferase family 2 protein n=1 Tax=Bacteroides clarus TaxID=626929 RepID=UPI0035206079
MRSPLVSVIIPTYNSACTITECINSVIGQTYENIEIVVVDDGSTDSTVAIVRELSSLSAKKIRLIKQSNSGPSSARNKGIEAVAGSYIAFLDSDDTWYPDKIARQVDVLQKNRSAMLVGCLYSIGDRQVFSHYSSEVENRSLFQLLLKNCFITSAVMCRREVLLHCTFNERQKYSEDYRLWLQLAAKGYTCVLQNEVLTKMNDKPMWGDTGLSAKLWLMEKGELSNYKFLYDGDYISSFCYLFVSSVSLCKYFRRVVLSQYRKISNSVSFLWR